MYTCHETWNKLKSIHENKYSRLYAWHKDIKMQLADIKLASFKVCWISLFSGSLKLSATLAAFNAITKEMDMVIRAIESSHIHRCSWRMLSFYGKIIQLDDILILPSLIKVQTWVKCVGNYLVSCREMMVWWICREGTSNSGGIDGDKRKILPDNFTIF